jgi:hypothetical protein
MAGGANMQVALDQVPAAVGAKLIGSRLHNTAASAAKWLVVHGFFSLSIGEMTTLSSGSPSASHSSGLSRFTLSGSLRGSLGSGSGGGGIGSGIGLTPAVSSKRRLRYLLEGYPFVLSPPAVGIVG